MAIGTPGGDWDTDHCRMDFAMILRWTALPSARRVLGACAAETEGVGDALVASRGEELTPCGSPTRATTRVAPTSTRLAAPESLSTPDVDTWVAFERRWSALLNGSYSETRSQSETRWLFTAITDRESDACCKCRLGAAYRVPGQRGLPSTPMN